MNIEVFKICAICFGSLAIICLIVALILFFKLKIPYVIGELRGNIKSISIQVKEQENKIKNDGLVSAKTPENEVKCVLVLICFILMPFSDIGNICDICKCLCCYIISVYIFCCNSRLNVFGCKVMFFYCDCCCSVFIKICFIICFV